MTTALILSLLTTIVVVIYSITQPLDIIPKWYIIL